MTADEFEEGQRRLVRAFNVARGDIDDAKQDIVTEFSSDIFFWTEWESTWADIESLPEVER